MRLLNRRQLLAAGAGVAGSIGSTALLAGHIWPLLNREDLIPGTPPSLTLAPRAWTETGDRVRIAAIGDNGSGGRHAMAVAERLALTYQQLPYGLVVLLGDICYYGNFEKRFNDVFMRPFRPLIEAGVGFELAVGNHDTDLDYSDEGLEEIEAELRLLGTPSRYYSTTHGPVDLFYLDSSVPGVFGAGGPEQWDWLDAELARSSNQWKIVALHHPPYSSGRHGSTVGARAKLEPILTRHHVDLLLAGHDHHYERTYPQQGVTYVVSGGGCKTTAVRPQAFTAAAASILQFVLIDIEGDRLDGRCIRVDGHVADRFTLRAREGR